MPSGAGRTVCLLSLLLSYVKKVRPDLKIVFATRSVEEIEQTIKDLKLIQAQQEKDFGSFPILALSLSSRRNLCIHAEVSKLEDPEKVDNGCRSKTAPWVSNS